MSNSRSKEKDYAYSSRSSSVVSGSSYRHRSPANKENRKGAEAVTSCDNQQEIGDSADNDDNGFTDFSDKMKRKGSNKRSANTAAANSEVNNGREHPSSHSSSATSSTERQKKGNECFEDFVGGFSFQSGHFYDFFFSTQFLNTNGKDWR